MWIKYVVTDVEFTIGLKFNPKKSEAVIGGWLKFYENIKDIMIKFFDIKKYYESYPNHNKVRYSFEIDEQEFFKAVTNLRESNINVVPVNKHGRLFR